MKRITGAVALGLVALGIGPVIAGSMALAAVILPAPVSAEVAKTTSVSMSSSAPATLPHPATHSTARATPSPKAGNSSTAKSAQTRKAAAVAQNAAAPNDATSPTPSASPLDPTPPPPVPGRVIDYYAGDSDGNFGHPMLNCDSNLQNCYSANDGGGTTPYVQDGQGHWIPAS
jgi:hypothetical protein